MLKNCLLLGCLFAMLSGVGGAAPDSSASPTAVAHKTEDPWQGLRATPAPILSFAGQSYFPVQANDRFMNRRWEFIGDGEEFAKAKRMVIIKIEPVTNLRAYEKALLAKMGVKHREVHYRSAQHLIHSWVTNKNNIREFRFMDWSMRGDGLQCCEVVIKDCFFLSNYVSPQWRRDLEGILAVAGQILPLKASAQ